MTGLGIPTCHQSSLGLMKWYINYKLYGHAYSYYTYPYLHIILYLLRKT